MKTHTTPLPELPTATGNPKISIPGRPAKPEALERMKRIHISITITDEAWKWETEASFDEGLDPQTPEEVVSEILDHMSEWRAGAGYHYAGELET